MRAVVRVITSLAGLAAIVGGVLLVVEVVGVLVRPDSGGVLVPWASARDALSGLTWRDAPVRWVAAGVALLGLLLLLAAFGAGRREIRMLDPAPEVTVTTDPRSLARLVGHQVRAEHGVARASVTANRSHVRVRAGAQFRVVGDLPERLAETTTSAVGELPLQRRPRVSVSVAPAKER